MRAGGSPPRTKTETFLEGFLRPLLMLLDPLASLIHLMVLSSLLGQEALRVPKFS